MSASIYWRPVSESKKSVETFSPSYLIESLRNAFGDLPFKLSVEDIPVLKGMSAVIGFNSDSNKPFNQLITAIESLGTIEIWAEW